LVELADVPHHVHVTHMVAVPRKDRAAVRLDKSIRLHRARSDAVRRIASTVSASSLSISSAAGSARESGAPWPDHMAMKSGRPALADAWRSLPMSEFCAGKAICGAVAISFMKRLARPRAGLPENFSVICVSSSLALSSD